MSTRLRHILLTSTALLTLGSLPAAGGPDGPQVVGGSATFTGVGSPNVNVNQTTQRAIINWNTFNIGPGETTTFVQPNANAVALNRVIGGFGPSTINGTLSANGHVFLINRDGVLIGPNGVINTAGFLATTNDIKNSDFMAGRYNFSIPGRSNASIINQGTITATSGGFAALVAPGVRNTGTITATLGTVALASGNVFTLDLYGDKLIQLSPTDSIASQVLDVRTGKPLKSLVSNTGKLSANGGRVELTAAAARAVVDSVINNKGVIEANSVGTRAGKIVLGAATGATKGAGAPKQTVKISGTLSAKGNGTKGGTIVVTGENIEVKGAKIDVAGDTGGGKVMLGGDWGGGNPNRTLVNNPSATLEGYTIATATTLTVDSKTTINASSTGSGNGGKVVLWSNQQTTFAGTILARGGEQGGNGGFVEVSSKGQLNFTGGVDTRAPNGLAGTLLLDPADYYIVTTTGGSPAGASEMTATALQTLLGTTNVTIATDNQANPSGQHGDIVVSTAVNWTSANSLTLNAYRNIAINANIANTGGAAIVLRADSNGNGIGTVNFGGGATVSTAGAVSIFYNPTSYASPTIYGGYVTGGGSLTSYMLVNTVTDLNNLGLNLAGTYALGRDIDASPASPYTGIGEFTGLFDGQNHTISNLTVAAGASAIEMNSGTIRNVNFTNVTVSTNDNGEVLGGLVGTNSLHGTINNVTITGTATGMYSFNTVGGLVGVNLGVITNSRSAVNVTVGDGNADGFTRDVHAGGLVGINYGSIGYSSASGTVTGGGNTLLGGLVGSNGDPFTAGSITNSYATGNVTSQTVGNTLLYASIAGGLVGDNWGSIAASYATGNVSNTGGVKIVNIGGLVGQNMYVDGDTHASITTSYASGAVSVTNTPTDWGADGVSAGGLVGATQAGTSITNSYALGSVTVVNNNEQPGFNVFAGGLVGYNTATIANAYSSGAVSATGDGNNYAGGFLGHNEGSVTNGYWDVVTSTKGFPNGVGDAPGSFFSSITGLKTDDARRQSSYGGDEGFDFANTWYMVEGMTRPILRAEWSSTINNGHQLQLIELNKEANYVLGSSFNIGTELGNPSGIWGPQGFVPIGSAGGPFTGLLDGRGYTITGLTITPDNESTQSIGLFSVIGSGGVVQNLNLVDAYVGANAGYNSSINSQWIGILAGSNAGTITNVTATGVVDGVPNGQNIVGVIAGGLVGQNGTIGPAENEFHAGTITNSHANVTVIVGNGSEFCESHCMFNAAGGLVGANVAGSLISGSYAEGNVTGGSRVFAGGLVGYNGFTVPANAIGTIQNSYATGNVTVTGLESAAGGLVGNNGSGSTIINGQAFGTVSATANWSTDSPFFGAQAGGLVGQNAGIITSTSHPTQASACAAGAAFSCATGTIFVGSNGTGGGLVADNQGTIAYSFATGFVTGMGGFIDDDNNGFSTQLGGLVGSNQGIISHSFATGDVGMLAGAPSIDWVGAGGLVGQNSGRIEYSFATGNVTTGANSVSGGLVGFNAPINCDCELPPGMNNEGKIIASWSTGAVTVGEMGGAGGLVGANNGTIFDSYHTTGAVTGTNAFAVGGFVGMNQGTIGSSSETPALSNLSYATSNVSNTGANGATGGFAGINLGSIQFAYAKDGNVSGDGAVGGFVGINGGTINQSYTREAVIGGNGSTGGGFVGVNFSANIEGFGTLPGLISQSYAYNSVTTGNNGIAAAFAALNLGTLNQTYGVGLVTGGTNSTLGGLVAVGTGNYQLPAFPGGDTGPLVSGSGTVTASYWDTQATGQTTSAGGTGVTTAQLAGAVPTDFDPTVWAHGSYPHLVNLGPQDNEPLNNPPDTNTPSQLLLVQNNTQSNPPTVGGALYTVPNLTPPTPPTPPQSGTGGATAQGGPVPGGPINNPERLNVGDGRYFYLPPVEETRLIPDEVVVQLPCDASQTDLNVALTALRLSVLSSECLAGNTAIYRLRTGTNQRLNAVISALAQRRIFVSGQANYSYRLSQNPASAPATGTPTEGDPSQYVLDKLRLSDIHRTLKATNVPIAVIDSEIDGNHPDLEGVIANRYDATGGAEEKAHPHGTGMAGAIASHRRLMGIAPGARIFAIRAFSTKAATAESTTYNILKGLDYAVKNNVRIVNMSFAGPRDPTLERAIAAAYDKGVIMIAAAGNAGPKSPPLYPGADKHVIAVTATDIDDKLFNGANRGGYISVAAPGVDILVPAPDRAYQMTTGTSVATAHVSGIVALMLERNPRLTPADVKRILTASAKRLGPNDQFGAGLIDPAKALALSAAKTSEAAPPVRGAR